MAILIRLHGMQYEIERRAGGILAVFDGNVFMGLYDPLSATFEGKTPFARAIADDIARAIISKREVAAQAAQDAAERGAE